MSHIPNCNTCGNCKNDCECIPQGLTTPNYCPSDLPPCPRPSPCNETFDSKCVIYTGDGNECLGIVKGDTVEEIINGLSTKLEPFFCLACIRLVVPANDALEIPYNQTLSWNAVFGAFGYNVYFGTDPLNLPLVSPGQISTSYTYPFPLLPNTTYYWRIVSMNSVGTSLNCPTYTFKTKDNKCVNPMSYFLDYVMKDVDVDEFNVETLVSAINNYLMHGELLTNCNFCCPDCEETDRYVLASAKRFAAYYQTFYNNTTCKPLCCIGVNASLDAMNSQILPALSLNEAFELIPPITNCCPTNFNECNQLMKDVLGTAKNLVYQANGVVEESSLENSTTICIIANFLSTLPVGFTQADKALIFNAILDAGFVVNCRPEGTIISGLGSVTTGYEAYVLNVQDGCICYKPC